MIPYVNRPAHPATLRRTEGLNDCMNAKSLLKIIPALMISAAMATTTIGAGKINPEAVSKGMLTTLNNQVGLSADQQDKAKSIIDKHVADLEAVKKVLVQFPWEINRPCEVQSPRFTRNSAALRPLKVEAGINGVLPTSWVPSIYSVSLLIRLRYALER
jgi:hypothetical protein